VLAHSIPFHPENDQQVFAEIPAASGVFILRSQNPGAEPYVSKSSNMRRRISRLLARPEDAGISKRLNLRERCAVIEYSETGSDFENTFLLYRVLREHFPKTYAKRLRLAPATMIKIDWANAYPRAYVTTKLGKLSIAEGSPTYYGPFRSRAVADKYANDVLDLFKSRRCTFELNPDPAFPGCVYSEMKMCLAPCFKGCTDEAYMDEVRRVEEFFATQGESMVVPITAERDQASEQLAFESAKTLHEKVEKLKGIARQADEIVRRIDQLDCIVVQPASEKDSARLFRFNGCQLCGPEKFSPGETPGVPDQEAESHPVANDVRPGRGDRLQEAIDQLAAGEAVSSAECMEHISILKRWYYRSHKAGEIIFRNADGSWPLRKLANAITRASGVKTATDATDATATTP
jgi:excinuclease UvrABC nuclease subunit